MGLEGDLIMWRLEVTRFYKEEKYDWNKEDTFIFVSFELKKISEIMEMVSTYGTDGTYTYKIEYVKDVEEGEQNEQSI